MNKGRILRMAVLLLILVLELALHWGVRSPYTYVITDYLGKKTATLDGVSVNWDVPHIVKLSQFLDQERFNVRGVSSIERPLYSFWGNALRPLLGNLLRSYIFINLLFMVLTVCAIYELAFKYFNDEWCSFACNLLFVTSIFTVCYISQPMFYILAFCYIPLALYLEYRLKIFIEPDLYKEAFFFLFLGSSFFFYDLQGLLLYYFLKSLFKQRPHRAIGLLGLALIPHLIWNPILVRWIFDIKFWNDYDQKFRLMAIQYWSERLGSFMSFYEGVIKAIAGYMRDIVCAFVLPLFIYALIGIVLGARRRLVQSMVLLFLCLSLPNVLVGPAVWEFNPRRASVAFWPVIVLAVEGLDSIFSNAMARARQTTGKQGFVIAMKWMALGLIPLFSNLDLFSSGWRQIVFLFHGDAWR